jgi:hypothetical protein
MDASAAGHAGFESTPGGRGYGHSNGQHSHSAPDPLRQLETELEATDSDGPDGFQAYEDAQALLDEAWNIFAECRVMREGLIEACQEIERTMDVLERRFGASHRSPQTNVLDPRDDTPS